MVPYYEQDGVTIYCGDCLDVLPSLETVDHVITDPPYAKAVYVGAGAIKCKEDRDVGTAMKQLGAGAIGAIDASLDDVAAHVGRIVRRWALVFSDVETCWRWRAALEAGGLRYVRTGAWVKPDAMPQMSGDRPAVGFEPATICHAQGPMRWHGGGHPAVWTHGTCKVDRPEHPCPKPESLMRELVALFTDPGELILDPFMGSGTTLVAAKRLGRKAIGIELNPKYCDIAINRLRQGALPLMEETA